MSNINIKDIQEFAQKVAEAISEVLDVDISIIDRDMMRIAGTGAYYSDINKVLSPSFASNKVIKTGQKCIILDPRTSDACMGCNYRETCKEKATILIPVIVDNNVQAVIGLFVLNDEDKNIFIKRYEKYANFMENMAELLSAKIKSEIMTLEALFLSRNLNAIIEAYPDGIMLLDKKGYVTHFNRSAEILLNIKAESMLNKHYSKRLICRSIDEVLAAGTALDSMYTTFIVGKQKIPMILTSHPIKTGDLMDGVVFFFQETNKTKKVYESHSYINARYTFDNIKGISPAITNIKELARRVSMSESTILLTGESGTGKEIFARAIHSASKRSKNTFVAINCSAIPDALLESELFGYEGGAFTGASKGGKMGKFELAHNGTLFLDEIGDMPMNLQAKLLRVLQDRVVERIGGTRPVSVDIRIIAATNKNLEELIKKNLFREDLYYRIKVIPITLPPLRERKDDIMLLSDYFLKKYNTLISKDIEGLHPDAIPYMLNYDWPGNIRELENAIEYAVNIETTKFITTMSLPSFMIDNYFNSFDNSLITTINKKTPLKKIVNESEKEEIIKLMSVYGKSTESKRQIAKHLNIGLSTLYRKLKNLDIH